MFILWRKMFSRIYSKSCFEKYKEFYSSLCDFVSDKMDKKYFVDIKTTYSNRYSFAVCSSWYNFLDSFFIIVNKNEIGPISS